MGGIAVANAPVSYGAFELTVGLDSNVRDGLHVLDEVPIVSDRTVEGDRITVPHSLGAPRSQHSAQSDRLDMQEVTGSSPVSPTIKSKTHRSGHAAARRSHERAGPQAGSPAAADDDAPPLSDRRTGPGPPDSAARARGVAAPPGGGIAKAGGTAGVKASRPVDRARGFVILGGSMNG